MPNSADKSKTLFLNMFSTFFGFGVSAIVSFFIVPIVKERVGDGAYGFISIADNFVQYAQIITIALNSMASRFITMKIYEKNYKKANQYFNSVIIADVFIALVFIIPGTYITLNVDKIFDVPAELVGDVKILFGFIFANFGLTIITTAFGNAAYIRNKLYISSAVTIFSTILRAVLIFSVYSLLPPFVFYMGMIPLIITLIVSVINVNLTKKLVPELKFSKKYFDFGAIKELVSSGIWNSIVKLGQVLLDGLDVLVANLFIGASAMDTLAISTTMPSMISSCMSILAGVFAPSFNISYAKKEYNILLKDIKQSIKIMSMITNIPIAVLTVFGVHFYKLWLPLENANTLYLISVIVVFKYVISGGINSLINITTVTNKLKVGAIAVLSSGILSIAFTFLMLNITDLGIYVIAGGSTIFSIARNLIYLVPYSAICLGLKWYTFYIDVLKAIISYLVMVVVGTLLVPLVTINSWFSLAFYVVLFCILCAFIGYFAILNKEDRKIILQKIGKVKH